MKRSSRTAAAVTREALKDQTLVSKTKRSKSNTSSAASKSTVSSDKPSTKTTTSRKSLKTSDNVASKKIKKASPVNEDEEVSPYFSQAVPSLTLNSNRAGSPPSNKLPRTFYDQSCVDLCKALLGTVLVRRLPETGEILRGTIIETEAYPGDEDKASQSYQGKRTPRNEAMFLDPGTAYVYFTYGMYYCFNITSRGEGAACLLRAIEPLEDYEIMHTLRKPSKKSTTLDKKEPEKPKKRLNSYELANGPSKLCMAFGIRRDNCDKIDMTISDELWIERSDNPKFLNREFEIESAKRIGIDSTPPDARNKLYRFYIKDSLAESRAKIGELKKKLAK